MPLNPSEPHSIVSQNDFDNWIVLNDTIMGGSSQGQCFSSAEGLLFKGELIEEGGGFVSCKSPIFTPSRDLSKFCGFQIKVSGQGRTLKFAVGCDYEEFPSQWLIPKGIKWVSQLPTNKIGVTTINIPFDLLELSLRAKPIYLPLPFNSSSINQFQLLHSKFGRPGELNDGFQSGKFDILLHSINVYS